MPNITLKSLRALALLMGIPDSHGWKSSLASKLDIELNLLSTWVRRNRIPSDRIRKIRNMGYPEDLWLASDDAQEPREQPAGLQPSSTHMDIVQRFQDGETALRINMKLLELEIRNPELLVTVETYLDGMLAGTSGTAGGTKKTRTTR